MYRPIMHVDLRVVSNGVMLAVTFIGENSYMAFCVV